MSLKIFHLVFITLSTLISIGTGAWLINSVHASGASLAYLGFGGFFVALGVFLLIYGFRFFRKMGEIKAAAIALILCAGYPLLTPEFVYACATCFGAFDGPQKEGLNAAIMSLLLVTASVLISFMIFFVYLGKRSSQSNEAEAQHERKSVQ